MALPGHLWISLNSLCIGEGGFKEAGAPGLTGRLAFTRLALLTFTAALSAYGVYEMPEVVNTGGMVALQWIFLIIVRHQFHLDQPDGSAVDLRLYPHAVDGHGTHQTSVGRSFASKKWPS